MSRIVTHPVVNVSVAIRLTEHELGALEALAGYDIESFLKVFYDKMGQHYLSPHEAGLRSLFKTIRDEAPNILKRANDARAAFSKDPT